VTIRVEVADLTLGEMAEVAELVGMSLGDAMTGPGQPRALAAIAFVLHRRDDPGFTFDQALALRVGDLEVVGVADPTGASNGGAPPAPLASGV
jgi:hypothetical protein